MNKYSASIGVWCLVALALVLVAEVQDAAAVNCSMLELSSCLGAGNRGRTAVATVLSKAQRAEALHMRLPQKPLPEAVH
ncbi:hypothetical protein RD792_016902 [Penstemon davidsonii]|uniref:Uncharacterized protein n=1 Tax=Penstemon davidsonii TaxID=160366 RepID=A0ABR0CKK9_9LAMI|nr:hypothetical protein RD792_016902 [Penstemon davidsonii]